MSCGLLLQAEEILEKFNCLKTLNIHILGRLKQSAARQRVQGIKRGRVDFPSQQLREESKGKSVLVFLQTWEEIPFWGAAIFIEGLVACLEINAGGDFHLCPLALPSTEDLYLYITLRPLN